MSRTSSFFATFIGIVVIVALAAAGYLFFRDMTPPQVTLSPQSGVVSPQTAYSLGLTDASSGLGAVRVSAFQDGKEQILLEKSESGAAQASETFSIPRGLIKEGPFQLRVSAGDTSLAHFGAGNVITIDQPYQLDMTPPRISVLSTQHYVNRGGVGFVVYQASEEMKRTGVQVKDLFFPGYRQQNGRIYCLFAFPWNMDRKDFSPRVICEDLAGNVATADFPYLPIEKNFRHDSIELSDRFLEQKMPQFANDYPALTAPLDIFLKVNREMREQNRLALIEIGRNTADHFLWQGAFLRMKNAKPMAMFGDTRSYMYKGEKVDEQTHLGQDLASLEMAPIEAANAGRVIFAEFFGIYGNCVIIDHGLGLMTIYAHMSSVDVHPGQDVAKGQQLGRSGATGMAGGDHLHFGVMVNGIEVQPIEWWDDHFLKDNILSKMENPSASRAAPPAEETPPAKENPAGKKSPGKKKK